MAERYHSSNDVIASEEELKQQLRQKHRRNHKKGPQKGGSTSPKLHRQRSAVGINRGQCGIRKETGSKLTNGQGEKSWALRIIGKSQKKGIFPGILGINVCLSYSYRRSRGHARTLALAGGHFEQVQGGILWWDPHCSRLGANSCSLC